jgi:hypothetical protein
VRTTILSIFSTSTADAAGLPPQLSPGIGSSTVRTYVQYRYPASGGNTGDQDTSGLLNDHTDEKLSSSGEDLAIFSIATVVKLKKLRLAEHLD